MVIHDVVRERAGAGHRVAKRMDDEVKKKSINPYAKSEIEKLIKSYNDMIGAANRLTFSKSMK